MRRCWSAVTTSLQTPGRPKVGCTVFSRDLSAHVALKVKAALHAALQILARVLMGGLIDLPSPQMNDGSEYDWKRLADTIPTREDFGRGLDENYAWGEFGGMSLDQAYEHFVACPENRQEDFMFMGSAAFLFYFPVIERYLYTVRAESEFHDCPAWILAMGIIQQLNESSLAKNEQLIGRVDGLITHVLGHLNQYATDGDEQERVASGWNELRAVVDEIRKRDS
jgi:hypothetical protein